MESSKINIEQLNFTRFIAAISIVVFHFGTHIFPFNQKYISIIFEHANYGVSYFFILSGFVMIIAYGQKKQIPFLNFIKKRFVRLYPVYLLALVLTVSPLIAIKNIYVEDVSLNLLLIQSWFPGKAITLNYPGWSLSAELFFYLLFPFLFNWIYKKWHFKILTIGGIIFWVSSQLIFHYLLVFNPTFSKYLYYLPLLHLNEFVLGNLLGFYFLNQSSSKKRNLDIPIIGVLTCLILALKFPFGFNYHNGLLAIFFLPLIILMSHSTGGITKFFKRKFFIFLGDISYSIYILQFPVWLWISDYRLGKYLGLEKDSNMNFYVKILFLIALSSLSYILIEKPLRKLLGDFRLRNFLKLSTTLRAKNISKKNFKGTRETV